MHFEHQSEADANTVSDCSVYIMFGLITLPHRKSYILELRNPRFFISQSCQLFITKARDNGLLHYILRRVFMSDIFEEFIPDYKYSLVIPLNKYSQEDLIEKGDELSVIFILNKV